jgi:ATP-binding protein involved in chromosome partitioning
VLFRSIAEAERLGVPVLAQVPIEIAVRLGGDQGVPAVIGEPKGIAAQAFAGAAKTLWGLVKN